MQNLLPVQINISHSSPGIRSDQLSDEQAPVSVLAYDLPQG